MQPTSVAIGGRESNRKATVLARMRMELPVARRNVPNGTVEPRRHLVGETYVLMGNRCYSVPLAGSVGCLGRFYAYRLPSKFFWEEFGNQVVVVRTQLLDVRWVLALGVEIVGIEFSYPLQARTIFFVG